MSDQTAETASETEEEMSIFLIVGVGGIGTSLSDDLCKMLEYRRPGSALILVDGDHFEEKNKERQNFGSMGNKAEVKAAELTKMFPNTTVVPMPKWVVETVPERESGVEAPTEDQDPSTSDDPSTKIEASKLLSDGQVVYAVVDNYKCRALLCETAATIDNIDVFVGGNDDALFGSVYHYRRRNGQDVTAKPKYWHPEFIDPPDRNPGDLSCEERAKIEGGTQLVATNRTVSAFMLGRTQHTIFEGNDIGEAASIYFNLADGSFNSEPRPPVNIEEATSSSTENVQVEVSA